MHDRIALLNDWLFLSQRSIWPTNKRAQRDADHFALARSIRTAVPQSSVSARGQPNRRPRRHALGDRPVQPTNARKNAEGSA